ncbi:MAG: hypothetical protein FJZ58_06060 [Chlamydiae bacterium]|nr:hypothetical protein [Chlamydiota bacterium]
MQVTPSYLPIPDRWLHIKTDGYDKHPLFCILTHLKEGGIPISKEQETIFYASRRISVLTSNYLSYRGFSILITAAAISSSASIPVKTYLNLPENSIGNLLMPLTLAFIGAGASNILGMLFTGTFPDRKSDKANEEQNEINLLKDIFTETGRHLVNLYCSKYEGKRKAAEEFAERIKIQDIFSFFKKTTTQEHVASEILRVLDAAILYVKSKGQTTPLHAVLREEIRYQRQRKTAPSSQTESLLLTGSNSV